ncbi:hypothetical protein DAM41_24235, partial [Salmonella enterica subsp. enterica serovar Enteritidis]|nr:hypothetical protein [Salmonella enterica subsp. enterica serovar Enteritidis]
KPNLGTLPYPTLQRPIKLVDAIHRSLYVTRRGAIARLVPLTRKTNHQGQVQPILVWQHIPPSHITGILVTYYLKAPASVPI